MPGCEKAGISVSWAPNCCYEPRTLPCTPYMHIGKTDKKQPNYQRHGTVWEPYTVGNRCSSYGAQAFVVDGTIYQPHSLLPWVRLRSGWGAGCVSDESFWQQPQLPPGPSLSWWLLGCCPITWGLHVWDVTGKWPLGKMAAGSSCRRRKSTSSLQPALLPVPRPSRGREVARRRLNDPAAAVGACSRRPCLLGQLRSREAT